VSSRMGGPRERSLSGPMTDLIYPPLYGDRAGLQWTPESRRLFVSAQRELRSRRVGLRRGETDLGLALRR
jgi:hypothetical protein